jgi:hypothetical protein
VIIILYKPSINNSSASVIHNVIFIPSFSQFPPWKEGLLVVV